MVKVKICGIKSVEAALCAACCGAWGIGFVFAASSRQVSLQAARDIIRHLPKNVRKVGVFVDAPRSMVAETIDFCGIDLLQFHGNESPEYCAGWNLPVIKAFRVDAEFKAEKLKAYAVDYYLLDSVAKDKAGGTGQTFDWRLLQDMSSQIPVILAGGINQGNAEAAVAQVQPFALDISSGVETNGEKDIAKIEKLFSALRRGEHE